MEYLRPAGVCTGRVILQLHGGGYIGPMKNIYRDFAIQYCRRSFGGDVLTVDYRVLRSIRIRQPGGCSGSLSVADRGKAL